MALSLKHAFNSVVADDAAATAAGKVTPTRWNAEHTITLAAPGLVGRATAGAGVVSELLAGQYPATQTNDSASAGRLGEVKTSTVAGGSAVSLTTATTADMTTLSLEAGNWWVWANVLFLPAVGTTTTLLVGAINTTSATLPTAPTGNYSQWFGSVVGASVPSLVILPVLVSIAVTTSYYTTVQAQFAGSTNSVYGIMYAERRR